VSDERGRLRDFRRSLLIDDAAVALGVSRRTVYYRIREGRLQTIRTRCGSQRVLVSSIEELRRVDRSRTPLAPVSAIQAAEGADGAAVAPAGAEVDDRSR